MAGRSRYKLRSGGRQGSACLFALLAWIVCAAPVQAEVGVGFFIENDFFGVARGDIKDRYYSNGFALSFRRNEEDVARFSKKLASRLFGDPQFEDTDDVFGPGGMRVTEVFSVAHSFFTPEDISIAEPQPDDHPYAGWLRGTYDLVAQHGTVIDSAQISLGLVGPAAQGKQLQRAWHNLIEDADPQGWDNQINNEPIVQAVWQRKWKSYNLFEDVRLGAFGFDMGIRPVTEVNLGNAFINGSLGTEIRIGNDLPGTFGAPRLGPAAPFTGFLNRKDRLVTWSVFAGTQLRLVRRNLFIEGNSFSGTPDLDIRPWVHDITAGFAIQVGHLEISYAIVVRSKEFDGQSGRHHFGMIGVTTTF